MDDIIYQLLTDLKPLWKSFQKCFFRNFQIVLIYIDRVYAPRIILPDLSEFFSEQRVV